MTPLFDRRLRGKSGTPQRRSRRGLALEVLEERRLLATWTNADSGNYHDPMRWTPIGVPGPGGTATFDKTTDPYTVTGSVAVPAEVANFQVIGGDVTFDAKGENLDATNLLVTTDEAGEGLATLTIKNSLAPQDPSLVTTANLLIGNNSFNFGHARFTVENVPLSVKVGAGATTKIGDSSNGELLLKNGATAVFNGIAHLGATSPEAGQTRVGEIKIEDNSFLLATQDLILGAATNTTGLVTLDIQGKLTTKAKLVVGESGSNSTLVVKGGSDVNATSHLIVGNTNASTGSKIDIASKLDDKGKLLGSPSTLTAGGDFVVGKNSDGTLNITKKASVSATKGMTIGENAPNKVGKATVDNSTLSVRGGNFVIGDKSTGELSILKGSQVIAQNVIVGNNTTSTGSKVDVASELNAMGKLVGSRSKFEVTGEFVVGKDGEGHLNISDQGFVKSDAMTIGENAGDKMSTVKVKNSELKLDKLLLGDNSPAELSVTNGATVKSDKTTLGRNADATVIVDGPGSTFDLGGLGELIQFVIGENKTATVTVTNGAKLVSHDGTIGKTPGAAGSRVTLDGTVWEASGDIRNKGRVDVINGGSIVDKAAATFVNEAMLVGDGTIKAKTKNSGQIRPGADVESIGELTIDHDFEQIQAGIVEIDVKNFGHDKLIVTGDANLWGNLHLVSREPQPLNFQEGHEIIILTADGVLGVFKEFDAKQAPIAGGLKWVIEYDRSDTDGDGQKVILRVVNPQADIRIDGFTPGENTEPYNSQIPLIVDYNIDIVDPQQTGSQIAPFEIGIFASPDGISRGQFLFSHLVDQANDLIEGDHTAVINPNFSDIEKDYFLMAVVDSGAAIPETDETNNDLVFAGGVFFDAINGIVQLHGSEIGEDVVIRRDTVDGIFDVVAVDFGGSTYKFTVDSVTEVHVRMHGGQDTVDPKIDDPSPAKNNQKVIWAFGGAGNDTLRSGFANDILGGGAGDDTFVYTGTAPLGNDKIYEEWNADEDTLDFTNLGAHVTVDLLTAFSSSLAAASIQERTGIERVIGTAYSDLILGNMRDNRLVGSGGDDQIWGRDGDDILWGDEDEEDEGHPLEGDAGNDRLYGGLGNDALHGGEGHDELWSNTNEDDIDQPYDGEGGVPGWTDMQGTGDEECDLEDGHYECFVRFVPPEYTYFTEGDDLYEGFVVVLAELVLVDGEVLDAPLTVNVSHVAQTALGGGVDYQLYTMSPTYPFAITPAAVATLTFPAGATTSDDESGWRQPVWLKIIDDNLVECPEQFQLVMSNLQYTGEHFIAIQNPVTEEIGSDEHGVTIFDNDGIATFAFVTELYDTAYEAAGQYTVDVRLLLNDPQTSLLAPLGVTVDYWSLNEAMLGVDVSGVPIDVIFPIGSQYGDTKSVVISIANDHLLEGDERFLLKLACMDSLQVTIVDNNADGASFEFVEGDNAVEGDSPYEIEVRLVLPQGVSELTGPLSVDIVLVQESSSADHEDDFLFPQSFTTVRLTFPLGSPNGHIEPFEVEIVDNGIVEADETFRLTMVGDQIRDVVIEEDDEYPTVVEVHYNTDVEDGDERYDRLTTVAITFDKDVSESLDAGDLTLWNITAGEPVDGASDFTWNSSTWTATWDFSEATLGLGSYEVRLSGWGVYDEFGNWLDGDADGSPIDDYVAERAVTAPTMASANFNADLTGGDQLFDTLVSVSFTFDREMDEDSFQVGDLVIWNLTTDAQVVLPPSTSTVTWDAETRTATWEFPDATVDFGWHEVRLLGDTIADLSGNLLDGDEDDLAGGDYVLPGDRVVTYAGDTDLDGDVDIDDMVLVSGNFTGPGEPGEFSMTWADGDFDGDGDIDIDDMLVTAGNFTGPGSGWGQTLAEGLAGLGELVGDVLTTEVLDSMAEAAIGRWLAAGLDSSLVALLSGVQFVIVDLPDAYLGFAVGNLIFIDIDAAGFGWYIDTTPDDDDEFSLSSDWGLEAESGSAAAGKVDLLTVLAHEFGHILGLEHDEESISGLMSEWLRLGIRRSDYEGAVDTLLAGEHWWEEEAA